MCCTVKGEKAGQSLTPGWKMHEVKPGASEARGAHARPSQPEGKGAPLWQANAACPKLGRPASTSVAAEGVQAGGVSARGPAVSEVTQGAPSQSSPAGKAWSAVQPPSHAAGGSKFPVTGPAPLHVPDPVATCSGREQEPPSNEQVQAVQDPGGPASGSAWPW